MAEEGEGAVLGERGGVLLELTLRASVGEEGGLGAWLGGLG